MKQIITDKADFRKLVTTNSVYVDKTRYLYQLLSAGNSFYFISRPRRFGKSTICDTLHELFNGEKELFEGLAISKTDYDFRKHPVVHLDFSYLRDVEYPVFIEMFQEILSRAAKENGVELENAAPSVMLFRLFGKLEEPVLIIDEYDSPIISALAKGSDKLASQIQDVFNSFFSIVKGEAKNIRFFFLTGVTKLSGLNIFSGMNNLKDLTLHPDYAGMFGYTEAELTEAFSEYIDESVAISKGRYSNRNEFLSALRAYYDGYRFSPDSEIKVYNPVSVGSYFSDRLGRFVAYWMGTGGRSSLAFSLARSKNLAFITEKPCSLAVDSLSTFDVSRVASRNVAQDEAIAMLYYSGYLTISDFDGTFLSLSFPNTEVAVSFTRYLLREYLDDIVNEKDQREMLKAAANAGDVRTIVEVSNEYYSHLNFKESDHCREDIVKILFKQNFMDAGFTMLTEVTAGFGYIDNLLITDRQYYIFEFKIDGKVHGETAAEQIENRRYASAFAGDKPLYLIGIDFNLEYQKIVRYTQETYGRNDRTEVIIDDMSKPSGRPRSYGKGKKAKRVEA